ncbi:MAG: dihydrodipicolinate reductase [Pseudomonadota bacterium]
MSTRATLFMAGLFATTCGMALADFTKVNDRSEFVALISDRTLTRPWINLTVTTDGRIEGMGARWEVTGNWSWQDGYFCRDLFWGGDEIGYNCQEVKVNGTRLRFTSDRGAGMSAVFRLND